MENKLSLSNEIVRLYERGELTLDANAEPVSDYELGLPEKPQLVAPNMLPKRGFGSKKKLAAMLHAITHIEYNAINIAWDAIYRFRNLPTEYYSDWLNVAAEETRHFSLLRGHLNSLGYDYGDFKAHDSLWNVVVKTADDPLVRMAIVPKIHEAHGLDVSPLMIAKFSEAGEQEISQTMQIIYNEEIRHVSIGNHWFEYLCKQRDLFPVDVFKRLFKEYTEPGAKVKLNKKARRQAGFTEEELQFLEQVYS